MTVALHLLNHIATSSQAGKSEKKLATRNATILNIFM
jgi:hypothetical protein